jgi:hypothetical protein
MRAAAGAAQWRKCNCGLEEVDAKGVPTGRLVLENEQADVNSQAALGDLVRSGPVQIQEPAAAQGECTKNEVVGR